MKIKGLGVDFNGKLLYKSLDEEKYADELLKLIGIKIPGMQSMLQASVPGATFKGQLERRQSIDLNDPLSAGWTYLFNENDPQKKNIESILAPLAKYRMGAHVKPLIFRNEPEEEWADWLEENYLKEHLSNKRPPHYILIAGNPQLVPFHFQSFLDTFASVGRIDFDDPKQLANICRQSYPS